MDGKNAPEEREEIVIKRKKGFDSRGMPLYKKPQKTKGKGIGLYAVIPKGGLLDPSLRRDIGDVPGLASSK